MFKDLASGLFYKTLTVINNNLLTFTIDKMPILPIQSGLILKLKSLCTIKLLFAQNLVLRVKTPTW